MSEPVVFISHFAVKEGALDELKRMSGGAVEEIHEGKPRTILFLSYLDEQGGRFLVPARLPRRRRDGPALRGCRQSGRRRSSACR